VGEALGDLGEGEAEGPEGGEGGHRSKRPMNARAFLRVRDLQE
jgi:hypothetical protein